MALNTTTPDQAAQQMTTAASGMDPNQPPPAAPPAATPVQTAASPQGTQMLEVQPAAPPPRRGITGVLDAVADMLAGRNAPDQISYDDNGQRRVTQGVPLSRGQQIAKIAMEGIQGAATAASAPPGPGHTAQGVAMALGQQAQQQQQNSQEREQRAQQDYQRTQQAKMQKLNYQILSRKLISDQLSDQLRKQQGTREQVDFSNQQIDREKKLGSFDLGFVNGAGDIADLGNKDPDLIKDYHDGRVVAWPVYDEAGKNIGLQVFRRKPDVNAQPLPDGQAVYKFIPPHDGKPATLTSYTPAKGSLSVGEADNLNMLEYGRYANWQKSQADLAFKNAETQKEKASTSEAYASAAKSRAETQNLLEGKTPSGKDNTPSATPGNGKPNKVPADVTKRAALARNVNENAEAVQTLLNQGADKLFGASAGNITSVRDMIGSNDKAIAALGTRFHNIALASNGAHGVRSQQAIAGTEAELFKGWRRGPDGVRAALQATQSSVGTFLQDEQNFEKYGMANAPAGTQPAVPPGAAVQPPAGAKVTVMDPNGNPHYFADDAAAQKFKTLAGIK